jgi:hypothetical protein
MVSENVRRKIQGETTFSKKRQPHVKIDIVTSEAGDHKASKPMEEGKVCTDRDR